MDGAFLHPCVASKGKGWNVPVGPARHYKRQWSQDENWKCTHYQMMLPLLMTPCSAHISLPLLAERQSAAYRWTQRHPILQICIPRESWGRQGWPVRAKWGTSKRAKATRAFFEMNSFPAFAPKSINLHFSGKITKTTCINSEVLGIDPSEVTSSSTCPISFRTKHLKRGHSQGSSTPASFLNINARSAGLPLQLSSADAFCWIMYPELHIKKGSFQKSLPHLGLRSIMALG